MILHLAHQEPSLIYSRCSTNARYTKCLMGDHVTSPRAKVPHLHRSTEVHVVVSRFPWYSGTSGFVRLEEAMW